MFLAPPDPFVSTLIETPNLKEFIEANITRYYNVIDSQIFLQEQGVSFSYTDSIPYYEREDLITAYSNFIELKNKRNQEAISGK